MKKITKADAAQRERQRREAIRQEQTRRADAVERYMLSRIRIWSLTTMLLLPLIVDGLLRTLNVWVDTSLAVFYPSTAVTALQWLLYYLVMLLRVTYQFCGFGVLGYSVMRFTVKKSRWPIVFAVVSTTVTSLAGIAETVYTEGINRITEHISYLLPLWVINYFLALFTTLCVIFLCAMLRAAFLCKGRMQVSITDESPAERKANVLRRLYLWIAGMLFLFNFIPGITNMIMEIKEAGAPGDIWDVISLLLPLIEIVLFGILGYYVMLTIGSRLTKQNDAQLARADTASVRPADGI